MRDCDLIESTVENEKLDKVRLALMEWNPDHLLLQSFSRGTRDGRMNALILLNCKTIEMVPVELVKVQDDPATGEAEIITARVPVCDFRSARELGIHRSAQPSSLSNEPIKTTNRHARGCL